MALPVALENEAGPRRKREVLSTESSPARSKMMFRSPARSARVVMGLLVVIFLWMPCETSAHRRSKRRGLSTTTAPTQAGKRKAGLSKKLPLDVDLQNPGSFMAAPSMTASPSPSPSGIVSALPVTSWSDAPSTTTPLRPPPLVALPATPGPTTLSLPWPTPTTPQFAPTGVPAAPTPFPSTLAPPPSFVPTSIPSLSSTLSQTSGSAGSGADNSSSAPTNGSNTSAVFCPGWITGRQKTVQWKYSVTMNSTSDTKLDAHNAVQDLEPMLLDDLMGLLQCNSTTSRRLASQYGIVGMDSLPHDLNQGACKTSSDLPCFVFKGESYIYLEDGANADVAIYETRKAIQGIMSMPQSFPIPQVHSVQYLGPALSNPSAAETSQGGSKAVPNGGSNTTSAVPILSAVGGFFLLISMFAAYRSRREKEQTVDGPSTIAPASDMSAGDTSTVNNPGTPAPPFTGMVPGAYRMKSSYTMNAILEDGSDVASYSRDSDIIVSECGYTDDDSSTRDPSYLNSMLQEDPILGAKGIEEYDSEEDYLDEASELPSLKLSSSGSTSPCTGISSPQEV